MDITLNFEKLNGLVPAAIQDASTGKVLMMGFMNKEALDRTQAEGQVIFWSRTKNRLWKKGETSGHFLNVVDILADCDHDSLLIRVNPSGPVCHTGEETCFQGQHDLPGQILPTLARIIHERKMTMPEGSYTARLLGAGPARIGQKVGEEGVELAIAAQYNDRQRCTEEAADLLYHLFVLLESKDIDYRSVYDELKKRMH